MDKGKIRCTLSKCIHSLAVDTHSSDVLINVFTGEVSESNVNVNKSIEIAVEQLEKFKKTLPDGFRDRISSKVMLMTSTTDKRERKITSAGEH